MSANRRNPGVHHTARQSRDGVPSGPGALADSVAGMRSGPRGYPGRGSDWGFTAVHFDVARPPSASRGPRLHDMRHRFATNTLVQWYRSEQDPERRLPILTAYLGDRKSTRL